MKPTWPWLIGAGLALAIAGATWALLPEEPPEPEQVDDTGMSDEVTDQLLQEIGYLKGTPEGSTKGGAE